MENKITKNLIILGAIVFFFAFASNTFAYSCYGYSCNGAYSPYYNYQDDNPGYLQNGYQSYVNPKITDTTPAVVNNYYYANAPASTTPKTNTTITSKQTTDTPTNIPANNTNGVNYNNSGYTNGLGASAYNGSQSSGNGITALSLKGSGGFMPSSVWQWIFVVILILIIIIIARMFVKKPSPSDHDVHSTHAH